MKTVLSVFLAAIVLCSCYSNKAQVQMTHAELVKIDTIYRYDHRQQVLTWRSEDKTEYKSYAALGPVFTLGSRVAVFVQK